MGDPVSDDPPGDWTVTHSGGIGRPCRVAHLTPAAGSRRGHGSAYAALSRGGIDTNMLGDVLASHRPAGWSSDFAVDATT